ACHCCLPLLPATVACHCCLPLLPATYVLSMDRQIGVRFGVASGIPWALLQYRTFPNVEIVAFPRCDDDHVTE
ncbi:hypothetical protein, partial [uncultured Sulfitobacter sp.]|uniref:hypothetical protein n=1 Tax=uncultured Sulfitobacter sp. TaxID=191468 RepID=UPI0026191D35